MCKWKNKTIQHGTPALFFRPLLSSGRQIGILAGLRPPGPSSYISNIIGTQMQRHMRTQDHISSCARDANRPSCTCNHRQHQRRLTGGNEPQPAKKANARMRKKIGECKNELSEQECNGWDQIRVRKRGGDVTSCHKSRRGSARVDLDRSRL